MPSTVHGTAIALADRAVLIRGPSGSGKSDLALRCISTPVQYGGEALAAALVSDDQTCLESGGGVLHVSPPPAIAGRLEVRGLGIVPVAWTPRARLVLVADIAPPETITRHPEPATTDIVGVSVPLLRIAAFEPSAPAKLLLALARLR